MARTVLVITFEHHSCVAQYNSDAEEKPLMLAAPVLSVLEARERRAIFTAPAQVNTCHCPLLTLCCKGKPVQVAVTSVRGAYFILLSSKASRMSIYICASCREKRAIMEDQEEAGENVSGELVSAAGSQCAQGRGDG